MQGAIARTVNTEKAEEGGAWAHTYHIALRSRVVSLPHHEKGFGAPLVIWRLLLWALGPGLPNTSALCGWRVSEGRFWALPHHSHPLWHLVASALILGSESQSWCLPRCACWMHKVASPSSSGAWEWLLAFLSGYCRLNPIRMWLGYSILVHSLLSYSSSSLCWPRLTAESVTYSLSLCPQQLRVPEFLWYVYI